jgi:hypothetical protein
MASSPFRLASTRSVPAGRCLEYIERQPSAPSWVYRRNWRRVFGCKSSLDEPSWRQSNNTRARDSGGLLYVLASLVPSFLCAPSQRSAEGPLYMSLDAGLPRQIVFLMRFLRNCRYSCMMDICVMDVGMMHAGMAPAAGQKYVAAVAPVPCRRQPNGVPIWRDPPTTVSPDIVSSGPSIIARRPDHPHVRRCVDDMNTVRRRRGRHFHIDHFGLQGCRYQEHDPHEQTPQQDCFFHMLFPGLIAPSLGLMRTIQERRRQGIRPTGSHFNRLGLPGRSPPGVLPPFCGNGCLPSQ